MRYNIESLLVMVARTFLIDQSGSIQEDVLLVDVKVQELYVWILIERTPHSEMTWKRIA